MEDWAEIRRLHRSEGLPIKEIARRMGIARNTVRAALRADGPPTRKRKPRGSLADAVEPQVRQLLAEFPRMPATVIAERIRWEHSMTTLKDWIRVIRPEYVGVDPVDRVSYEPGRLTPVRSGGTTLHAVLGEGFRRRGSRWHPGQERVPPVLVMTLAYSRFITATMIPSRQGGDILSGMWALISQVGKVTKTLLWDRESAIGGTGKVTVPATSRASSSKSGSCRQLALCTSPEEELEQAHSPTTAESIPKLVADTRKGSVSAIDTDPFA